MTQKDKELLIKDLCGRLPYGVKCSYLDIEFNNTTYGNLESFEYDDDKDVIFVIDGIGIYSEHVKPYLFPMSSMTKEQKIMIRALQDMGLSYYHLIIDHYNEWHLDYRDFIGKGLANDATGLNIY